MSATDYVGRTIDVAAYDAMVDRGSVQLLQAFAQPGTGGKVYTGVLKLAQRVILEFLTEQGSMPYWPARGCSFMTEVYAQRLHTSLDVFQAAARGLLTVRRNLQSEESASDPLDERLSAATVTKVEVADGTARLWLRVVSRDANAKAIVPISISM